MIGNNLFYSHRVYVHGISTWDQLDVCLWLVLSSYIRNGTLHDNFSIVIVMNSNSTSTFGVHTQSSNSKSYHMVVVSRPLMGITEGAFVSITSQ